MLLEGVWCFWVVVNCNLVFSSVHQVLCACQRKWSDLGSFSSLYLGFVLHAFLSGFCFRFGDQDSEM